MEELVFQRIKEKTKVWEIKGGDYLTEGGIVYRFLPTARRDGYYAVSVGFRSVSEISFIESILRIATIESPLCELRISARGPIDFQRILLKARTTHGKELRVAEGGNFCFSIRASGREITVNAYPSAGALSIEGTYNSFTMKPEGILREVMGIEGDDFVHRLAKILHFH